MIRPFSTKGPNGEFFAALNEVIKEVNRQKALSSPDMLTSRTTNGVIRKPKAGFSTSDDWANPIIYDNAKSYSKGKIVVIRPTDTAVTTGFLDAETGTIKKSSAGTWKATQPVSPVAAEGSDTKYRVPRWPLPTPYEPDAENVYWWPLSLICTD